MPKQFVSRRQTPPRLGTGWWSEILASTSNVGPPRLKVNVYPEKKLLVIQEENFSLRKDDQTSSFMPRFGWG
jgi:hypothetical protein